MSANDPEQMYSKMVDKCFNDCIDDFTSKSVSSREEGCLSRCWDKNMKAQERIQVCLSEEPPGDILADALAKLRFQEQNEAMMASGSMRP